MSEREWRFYPDDMIEFTGRAACYTSSPLLVTTPTLQRRMAGILETPA